jgi:hypothetical protein
MALIATVALLSACGSDGSGEADAAVGGPATSSTTLSTAGDDWPYSVDDYVAEFDPLENTLTAGFPPDEQDCFVRGMVEGVGLDRLAGATLTPEQFAAADDFEGLVDDEAAMVLIIDSLADCVDIVGLMVAEEQITEEHARCLREDVEPRSLVMSLLGSTDGQATPPAGYFDAYNEVLAACPEALGAILG